MATAAEEAVAVAQAEEPAPASAPARPSAQAEKRAPADEEEEEEEEEEPQPEPKRRRACVAALEGVQRASAEAGGGSEEGDAAGAGGGRDGGSSPFRFSFHARSFSGVETTPRFGSFNPADDLAVFQPKPPAPPVDAPSKDVVEVAAGDGDGDETTAEEEGSDGNSHLLGLYPSEAKPIE